jgi:hypothetical protein
MKSKIRQFESRYWCNIFFVALQTKSALGRLEFKDHKSHSDTKEHTVRTFWKSDQPSQRLRPTQRTTNTTEKKKVLGGIRSTIPAIKPAELPKYALKCRVLKYIEINRQSYQIFYIFQIFLCFETCFGQHILCSYMFPNFFALHWRICECKISFLSFLGSELFVAEYSTQSNFTSLPISYVPLITLDKDGKIYERF